MKNWKWTIGSAPAAIAPGGVVVLESGYEQLAHRLWEMLNADAGLGRILQEITAASNADLESLPSFVVMIHNGDSEHIAVRGSFDIDLHGAGHTQTISGASLITWSEQRDIRAEGWRIRSTLAAIDPVATEWAASSGVLPVHTLSFGSEGSESSDSDKEGDTAALTADLDSDVADTDVEAHSADPNAPVAILDEPREDVAPATFMALSEGEAPVVDPSEESPAYSVMPDLDHSAADQSYIGQPDVQDTNQGGAQDIVGSTDFAEGTYVEDDPASRIGDTNKEPEVSEFVPSMSDTDGVGGEDLVPAVDEPAAMAPLAEESQAPAGTSYVIEDVEVVEDIAILDDDTPMVEEAAYEAADEAAPERQSAEDIPAEYASIEDDTADEKASEGFIREESPAEHVAAESAHVQASSAEEAATPVAPAVDEAAVAVPVVDPSPAAGVPTNISEEYPAEFTSGKFFIDSVPAEFIPTDTQSSPDDLDDLGDHAGDTVMVPSTTITDPQEEEEVPQILAILCEDGHPNPTHVKQCRVCEKPMSRNLVRVPRPPLGSLIFSTGEIVSLDRDVVVGRRPSAKPQEGRLEPRLVALPSPNREISRNHCEIRVDGWDIRIRDLGSNNGTFLTREGQEPLRVGEAFPVILRNGDTIDLGESITIRLEY